MQLQERLNEAFKDFRERHALTIQVRRYRASQIRQLLSNADTITVQQFNDEVWPLERATFIEGKPIKLAVDVTKGSLSNEADIWQALEHGTLDLHGNYTWGSATRVFGSTSKDETKKLEALRQAVRILNDSVLTPLEKAVRLKRDVYGFGPNIATGLVMMFHPHDFAISNAPSREALVALGYHIGQRDDDFATFLNAVRELRQVVGASDFLELDYFLYLITQRTISIPLVWWVNQNASYAMDRDKERLFTTSTRDVRGDVIFHRDNINKLRPNDTVVHYSDGSLTAVSRVISPHEISAGRLNGSTTEGNGILVRTTPYVELNPPQPLMLIPANIRLAEWHGAFTYNGAVNQGYIFSVTPHVLEIENPALQDALYRLAQEQFTQPHPQAPDLPIKPSRDELACKTFLDVEDLSEIETLLRLKQQVIIEGPPGAGKTYLSEMFARYFTGNSLDGEVDDRVRIIQFHQSYSYEDFVQGIRPVMNAQGQLAYELHDGIFKRLCDDASKNPDKDFVLIIDEINRGNVARIFGELLLLLEYRLDDEGRAKMVTLPYAKSTDPLFAIPGNVYLIGTMNTADRSLAQIDYALRRRFYFYRLMPVVNGDAPVLQRWLSEQEIQEKRRQKLLRLFIALNQKVTLRLGDDFQIGHSYFMTKDIAEEDTLNLIWRRAIMPLLGEYFFNQRNRREILDEFEIDRLLSTLELPDREPSHATVDPARV